MKEQLDPSRRRQSAFQGAGRRTALLGVLAACVFGGSEPVAAQLTSIKLNAPLVAGGDVHDFKISPLGDRVVYTADLETDFAIELYSVSIDGGPSVRLSGSLQPGVGVNYFEISPDGSRVVYRHFTPGGYALYSVPIDGPSSAGVKLSRPLLGGVAGIGIGDRAITPDSQWVVYAADHDEAERYEIYRAPIDGSSSATKVNGSVGNDPDGVVLLFIVPTPRVYWLFNMSPDGSRVVYRVAPSVPNVEELFSVPLAGPTTASVRIFDPSALEETAQDFKISPDNSRVVYRAEELFGGPNNLYSVPIAGPAGDRVRLNNLELPKIPSTEFGPTFDAHWIAPDSSRVIYKVASTGTLYSVPLTGPARAGVAISGGVVASVEGITPDNVVYTAHPNVFSVPIIGPTTATVMLNQPLSGGQFALSPELTPDGGRVVFIADQDTEDRFELYSVPVGGPASAAIKLNINVGQGGNVTSFAVSPDGLRVAYRADRVGQFFGDDIFRLWITPIMGPARATLDTPLPVFGGDVSTKFSFTPDSSRVVYIADQDTDDAMELYVTAEQSATGARAWKDYE